MSTIFQKIIDREIPADIVYEDEHTLAFLDINPTNKGHALVIPKQAFENVFDADIDLFAEMAATAVRVSRAIKSALNADGVNLIMNNGEHAGQEVFHAHIHVVPRFKNDDVFQPAKHTNYEDGESAQVATQIIAALEE
ncbi:MAG: HIT family protein [Patescibacteria group bacterium]